MASPGLLAPYGTPPASAPAFGPNDSVSQSYELDEGTNVLWWRFTAPSAGTIALDTASSTKANGDPLYPGGAAIVQVMPDAGTVTQVMISGVTYTSYDAGASFWIWAYGVADLNTSSGAIIFKLTSKPVTLEFDYGAGPGVVGDTEPPGPLPEIRPGQYARTELGSVYYAWYEVFSPQAGYITIDTSRDPEIVSYIMSDPIVTAGTMSRVNGFASYSTKNVYRVSAGARGKIKIGFGNASISVSNYMTATPWVGGETVEEVCAANSDNILLPGDKILSSTRMGFQSGISGGGMTASSTSAPLYPFNPKPESQTDVIYASAGDMAALAAIAGEATQGGGGISKFRASVTDDSLDGRAVGFSSVIISSAAFFWKTSDYWVRTTHEATTQKRYMFYEYRLEPSGGSIQAPPSTPPDYSVAHPGGFVLEKTAESAILNRVWFAPDRRPIPSRWTDAYDFSYPDGPTYVDAGSTPLEELPNPAHPYGMHWGTFTSRRERTTSGNYYLGTQDEYIALMGSHDTWAGDLQPWRELDPSDIAAGTWFRLTFEPLEDYKEWTQPPSSGVIPHNKAVGGPQQQGTALWSEKIFIGLPSFSFKAQFEMPAYRAIPLIDLEMLPLFAKVLEPLPEIDDSGPFARAYFISSHIQ